MPEPEDTIRRDYFTRVIRDALEQHATPRRDQPGCSICAGALSALGQSEVIVRVLLAERQQLWEALERLWDELGSKEQRYLSVDLVRDVSALLDVAPERATSQGQSCDAGVGNEPGSGAALAAPRDPSQDRETAAERLPGSLPGKAERSDCFGGGDNVVRPGEGRGLAANAAAVCDPAPPPAHTHGPFAGPYANCPGCRYVSTPAPPQETTPE